MLKYRIIYQNEYFCVQIKSGICKPWTTEGVCTSLEDAKLVVPLIAKKYKESYKDGEVLEEGYVEV